MKWRVCLLVQQFCFDEVDRHDDLSNWLMTTYTASFVCAMVHNNASLLSVFMSLCVGEESVQIKYTAVSLESCVKFFV